MANPFASPQLAKLVNNEIQILDQGVFSARLKLTSRLNFPTEDPVYWRIHDTITWPRGLPHTIANGSIDGGGPGHSWQIVTVVTGGEVSVYLDPGLGGYYAHDSFTGYHAWFWSDGSEHSPFDSNDAPHWNAPAEWIWMCDIT